MIKIIRSIRGLIFSLFFFLWLLVLTVFGFPLLIFPRMWTIRAVQGWLWVVLKALKYICGVSHEVRGRENIPKDAAIIASKHQSAWETFFLMMTLHDPAFVMKKELLYVPFYGWYVWKSGHIAINRAGGAKSLKMMVAEARKRLDAGRQIIIFPQGTRVKPGHAHKYQAGTAAIYSALDVPVVPVALNSGVFWHKRQLAKQPGTIVIEFLPALPPKMDKREFLKTLEAVIEGKSNSFNPELVQRQP